ncbi:MAG: hypothetical protein II037_01125, partial [Bacteroidales bacterium]|nr:hypothetical protein [Bacteroidales bacterium]
EYEAFKAEHGSFYANDNILVLADTVNYSTGADMKMQVKQGILTLEPDGGFNCREQSMVFQKRQKKVK